jgi:hypothetical protein
VKDNIKQKLVEHRLEMEAAQKECERIKASLPDIQKEKGINALMLETNKMLVIKDKVLFHKAAVAVLEDILHEESNG